MEVLVLTGLFLSSLKCKKAREGGGGLGGFAKNWRKKSKYVKIIHFTKVMLNFHLEKNMKYFFFLKKKKNLKTSRK